MATALAFPISALATVDPIRISPDASTETKFQEQQRAWSERVFFETFRERAHGKPWAQAGQTFVKQALDDWPSDRYSSEAPRIAELGACRT